MAKICCGVVSDSDASAGCEGSSRDARRRRMEIRRFKFVADSPPMDADLKRQKLDSSNSSSTTSLPFENASGSASVSVSKRSDLSASSSSSSLNSPEFHVPRFGVASVCGRRRDMEDAVSVQPSFLRRDNADLHYFGVFDGHGCSHVAMRCKERLHELVKEELTKEAEAEEPNSWKDTMERSYDKMDKEVVAGNNGGNCCESQTPECENAGSTAVIAVVTPQKIIVANCGDSRAVLCRNGKPIPLSTDHKPDRPNELSRIEEAGGRVIFLDAPRVLGVLAMSRAIGDNYLKPYVCSVPEVTITDRTAEDEGLILASDGLWDVVSNDIACGVARMCLREKAPSPEIETEAAPATSLSGGVVGNKMCSDASMLLTKLALARHSSDNVSVVVVALGHV